MSRLADWRVRALYLSCVLLIPFLWFIAKHEYGFLHREVLAAAALLALECVVLALVARGVWFYLLTAASVAIVAANPVQHLARVLSPLSPWVVALAIALVTFLLARRMREKFFPVLAVFALSGLGVELAAHLTQGHVKVHARGGKPMDHVLWLVLDEQTGLGGYPTELPACASAMTKLQAVLEHYNFTLFPNAYSNYPMTADSVPSILNERLAGWPGEWMARTGPGGVRNYGLLRNPLLDEYTTKGYHAIVWQHAAMRLCGTPSAGVECRDYEEKLKWLHRVPGSWTDRFRRLVGSYQSSDPMLMQAKGFFPFRFRARVSGPPSLEGLWPEGVADEIAGASARTFFFAHLLTPHSPYLYHRDGSLRPLEEWTEDRTDQRLGAREYEETYGRYCEQSEYAATQLDGLLGRLDNEGLLRRMTVIVHGDHGSRIRRSLAAADSATAGAATVASPDYFDYSGAPSRRDLLDRFSTLLAIKRPAADRPETIEQRHSVLTLLSRFLFEREPADGIERADQAFLKAGSGAYRAIDIQQYWR